MRFLILTLIVQFTCTTCFPQECGDASINDAQNMYSAGRFDESISTLNNCLYNKQGFNFDQKVQVYHLLALCYLAIDSISNADSSIQQLLILKDDFEPPFGDPERFAKELMLVKSRVKNVTISSVSKRPEDIRTAPATALIITQEEILQRGYTDIVDVLKDLPGFDITIYYGQTYADIYQRGLRTNFTEKTLILIDGVEDNDLWTHIADISQQYPITNIKRIEVIYGPSSTMYGPNAFSGVINIITKEPGEYIKNNNSFGIHANAGIGSYHTQYVDVSSAFKKGIFSMSVTARVYHSERPNLSSQQWWDYDPSVYDTSNIDYQRILSITKNARDYLISNNLPLISNLYNIDINSRSIILSEDGKNLASNLDKAAYNQNLLGVNVQLSLKTMQKLLT